ncbi:DUF4157 domain-containing protein [Paenibacillus hunanensis]|uniref:eCIS core domain-containing protein n=1 Tax=Paenibacillus hunanensis TaxID=539262 RepID=UPI0020260FA3|nr:DUF4157 domain-containing protein [Paenibacillus hunanensis]MCL9661757.1 DUF4157 domain-containing protein [Paenibacillus hunanensis]
MYQSEPPRKNNASPQHVSIQREEVIRSPQTESFNPDKEMFASGTGTAQLMALQKVLGNRGTMQRVRAEQQTNALIQRAAEEEAGDMDELEAMMQPQEMEGAAEAPSGAIPVQRMEAEDAPEADELEALLQAQEVDEGTTSDDMPVQRAVEAVPSSVELPGSAAALNQTGMPDALKSGIESMSGMDMSDVRVHYNSREPDKVNAHAYAQGSDIHLAPGQDQHLPHEAWHVVQQRQGRVQPTMQLESGVSINDDAGLEQEATDMGARALSEGVTQRQVVSNVMNRITKRSTLIQAQFKGHRLLFQFARKKGDPAFEAITDNPISLSGKSESDVQAMLGDGWTRGIYGSSGWKFIKGDKSVFFHPGGGIHVGSYIGFSSSITGKVKIVGSDYKHFDNDKATIYKV